jgi:hypothetical protein
MMFTAMSFFADLSGIFSINNDISLQQIIENGSNCINKINGNKVYLKADCISISENGIYLSLNEAGDTAYIPELYADESGAFINVGLISRDYYAGAYQDVRKECPGCGQMYFGHCKNPDCPLKKKK